MCVTGKGFNKMNEKLNKSLKKIIPERFINKVYYMREINFGTFRSNEKT